MRRDGSRPPWPASRPCSWRWSARCSRSTGRASAWPERSRGSSRSAAVTTGLGVAVAYRRPDNPVGALLTWVGTIVVFLAARTAYAEIWVHRPDAVPLDARVVAVLEESGWWLWTAAALLLLYFPDGKVPGRRWRWVPYALVAATAVQQAYGAFGDLPFLAPLQDLPRPWGSAPTAFAVVGEIGFFGMLALAAACVASLVVRFRRSTGARRAQLKWLSLAGFVIVVYPFVCLAEIAVTGHSGLVRYRARRRRARLVAGGRLGGDAAPRALRRRPGAGRHDHVRHRDRRPGRRVHGDHRGRRSAGGARLGGHGRGGDGDLRGRAGPAAPARAATGRQALLPAAAGRAHGDREAPGPHPRRRGPAGGARGDPAGRVEGAVVAGRPAAARHRPGGRRVRRPAARRPQVPVVLGAQQVGVLSCESESGAAVLRAIAPATAC